MFENIVGKIDSPNHGLKNNTPWSHGVFIFILLVGLVLLFGEKLLLHF